MPTDRPPLSRSFSGPLTQVVAAFVLSQMRRMEEERLSAEARWEFLRRQFERIAASKENRGG